MGFRLGEWYVEPSLNRISKAGADVRLEPKVMELLVLLTEEQNAVLTKEQIIERLWPGTFVTESSVFRHVSELRRALGDDSKNPRYVHTIPKKGYRVAVAANGARSRPRSWLLVPALALAAILLAVAHWTHRSERPRVATLPFEPAGDVDSRIVDGLGAMLRNKLVLLPGIEVVEARDTAEAETLDARAALGGTVSTSGDAIAVSVELIEPRSRARLWSQDFRGSFEAHAAHQNEMVVSIARAMDAEVSARDTQRLTRQSQRRPARSGACDTYLRAELFENRVDCSSFERAIEL